MQPSNELRSYPPHPPRLSLIVQNDDYLQPNEQQIQEALVKSREYWYHLASFASVPLRVGIAPDHTNPRYILQKVPKFQGHLKAAFGRPLGRSPSVLCLQASTTWKPVASSDCDRLEKETSFYALLQVGITTAIPYNFKGTSFKSWIGTREEKPGPNYLGILTIGWCYILSARLVEILGGGTMRYTNSQAESYNKSLPYIPESYVIDVGEVDEKVARWWSAILAQREGWEVILKESPEKEFFTPWTVSRTCETSFTIKSMKSTSASSYTPLSSSEAFEALIEFACLHESGSQFPVALSIAMILPVHQYYGSSVQLPPPGATSGKKATSPTNDIPLTWANLNDDLPYYITLSCSPVVLMSVLCGSFWEPEVPCNLVSPWLHPFLNEVLGEDSGTIGSEHELLAFMGAVRRPNLSALWIGASASGLGPKILQKVRGGRPPLDSLGYPWTSCPQSFMDIAGSGTYSYGDPEHILRADVWRLLYLPSTEMDDGCYSLRGPSVPWEPCGASIAKDCLLRVTSHLKCPRHEYQYDHWNWELTEEVTVQDYGFFRSSSTTFFHHSSPFPENDCTISENELRTFEIEIMDSDQDASRDASFYIFHWVSICGDGIPPERIYRDEWLKEIWDDEDVGVTEIETCDQEESQGLSSQSGDQIESWLNQIS